MPRDPSAAPRPSGSRTARLLWIAFGVACLIQLVGLYAPSTPGSGGIPGIDKVGHVAMFGLVMATGLLAGVPARWLAPILVVHAVASELVQHVALPDRSGDPWDVVADMAGVALGWVVALAILRRRARPTG